MSRRWQIVFAFALVYVFWGSTYLAIGLAVEHLTPLLMGGLRFTVAGAMMLGFCALTGRRLRVSRGELLRLTLVGIQLLILANVVTGWAERYVPTGLAALLMAVTPLWFLLLERLTGNRERLSWRGLGGILLGLVGVAVLLWPDLSGQVGVGRAQLFGAALLMFSSLSWACGSICAKHFAVTVDSFVASGWQMLMAGILNALLAVAGGDLHRTDWGVSSLWAVVYLIFAGSLVGYTAYVWLVENVPIAKVATYAYVNPIVAVILGCLLHHERVDRYTLAGAAIIVASVVLVTGARVRSSAKSSDEPLATAEDSAE